MEYDSSSSCEERQNRAERETSMRTIAALSWYDGETLSTGETSFPVVSKRSLSAQVMEYYRKYSQNSTLGRYFSLPEGVASSEVTNFHRSGQISIPETRVTRESYVLLTAEERSRLESTPRERRRWARPPLIGQPSTSESVVATNYGSITANQDSRTPSPISKRPITETILEEKNESRETLVENSKDNEVKATSPTSSVASHKPLEWDSGADVGYYNAQPRSKDDKDKKLCTIERMALARGCSVAMRLDPEGKNESASLRTNSRGSRSMKPDANSTPLIGHVSDYYESEIAITPIVKNHEIIEVQQRREIFSKTGKSVDDEAGEIETHRRAEIKYPTEGSRSKETRQSSGSTLLKKSSSMNLLALPMARLSLKRSQSELNLRARDKKIPPVTFDSTSSIATVVDKPRTCDKFIQTSLDCCSRESVGIQVEVREEEKSKTQRIGENIDENGEIALDDPEEEKPPLPKRASSLAPKIPPSILKNSKKNRDDSRSSPGGNSSEDLLVEKDLDEENENDETARRIRRNRGGGRTRMDSSSERSRRDSSSSARLERTEDDLTGRASNSFEYFPGHVYQNVNGGNSGISSIETGRESRCSTMPNTSSSIDEKLWGDSDSLVRDLERRVNVLKSLVDGNKCDKQVKKRLIHHIIKRLVTAKYMDERIERDLEENVPWNPADARKKIYRNEIIQALANKNNTTDSSYEDWRPRKRNLQRCPSPERSKEGRSIDDEIDVSSREASTENSDKFTFDRHNNDGAVMDGRKARMGLRNEDRGPEANIDGEKSESSECFLPQTRKATNVYYSVERSNEKSRPSKICMGDAKTTNFPTTTTTTTTTTNGTNTISPTSSNSNENQIGNRIILVKEKRRTKGDDPDWRLPTTMSERRFELGRCSNSESGEAKLINYAEMEKRNQLVWITNEISHLCNLKRLLEEPHTIEDRSRKNINGLPIDSWIVQAHVETNASNRSDRGREIGTEASASSILRDESLEKSLDNQWSSHGNLACGRSNEKCIKKRDDERSGPTRKRNSCTQTGNDGGLGGHSKTGGEIVSASLPVFVSINSTRANRQMVHEMRDVSVQTQMEIQDTYQNVNSLSPQIMSDSQINGNDEMCAEKPRHVCYCQRYAAHSRHRACVIHSPLKRRREHAKNCPRRSSRKVSDRPIITQPISQNIPGTSVRSMDSRKEAKNQLNATCKSKYAIHELSEKSKTSCARCEEKKRQPEVATETLKTGVKNTRMIDVTDDCVCRDTENDENDEKSEEFERLYCETGSERETRYRDNSSSQPKCTCNFEQNVDAEEDTSGSVNRSKMVAEGKAKSCKSCRTCGTVWLVKDGKNANRRCKCSQDYLKPVAYEIKFNDNFRDKEKSRDSLQKNSREKTARRINKIRENGTSTYTKTRTKATQSPPSAEKSQGHYDEDESEREEQEEEDEEDEEKQESANEDEHPGTLKDFLATNKPEFLENVETRRRYMSEISQLRQLKREKRKQFLALAGSASFLKPSRPVKGSTAHSQKKLSESEMKLRLRMRYLRLNEVRNKRRQREKEEDARRNQLMAKLFGQKLQQKVLNGQVDLSQSVSVISNL